MSKFNFHLLAKRVRGRYPTLLNAMGNNAVNFFKVENFNAESFIDEPPKRWEPRKSKKDNAGRRLLVKTGRGRASIKILSRDGRSVKVGTLVPYMKFHNKGTKDLTQRQFIGNSQILYRRNGRVIYELIDRTIKSFGGR